MSSVLSLQTLHEPVEEETKQLSSLLSLACC